jgi:hypothetical protein
MITVLFMIKSLGRKPERKRFTPTNMKNDGAITVMFGPMGAQPM